MLAMEAVDAIDTVYDCVIAFWEHVKSQRYVIMMKLQQTLRANENNISFFRRFGSKKEDSFLEIVLKIASTLR